jgi:hypothetical protein
MEQWAVRKMIAVLVVGSFILMTIACGSAKFEGTYTNATGLATLNLSSGGKASMTMMGETKSGTFTVDGNKVIVNLQGDKLEFTINEDGSLNGPGFIGAMKKSKS